MIDTDSRPRDEHGGSSTTSAADNARKPRAVTRIVRGTPARDGAGVSLTRVIGGPELDMLDPFLLLDSFESDDPDDYIAGFPAHPHRGFETVTYMLKGRMRHSDNQGHSGLLGPGSVQWMTAGRGIVHSEMPEQERGLMHGFQLWVNLPRAHKMTAPGYREFDADEIPSEASANGTVVRVIAGTTDSGTPGPVTGVVTAPLLLDVSLPGGRSTTQSTPDTHNAFIYVIEGDIVLPDEDALPGRSVGPRSLAVLGDGDCVTLEAGESGARCLVAAAKRIGEPVARGGPFVMNTREEIIQAAEDFRRGVF